MNSVTGRPFKPGSNFMVGTHRPKSRPGIVDFCTDEVLALEVEDAAAVAEVAGTGTVTKVVGTPQALAAAALVTLVEAEEAVEADAAAATLGASPVVPSRPLVVKLEKPWAAMT